MAKMTKEERRARSKERETVVSKADATKQKSTGYLQLPNGVEKFKPEEKTYIMDILYYERKVACDISNPIITLKEDKYKNIGRERPYLRHSVNKQSVACPRTIGKKCPICEEVDRLRKNWDENKDTISEIRAKPRNLFNIMVDGKHYVHDVASSDFEAVIREELKNGAEDLLDIEYLEDGKSLKIRYKQSDFSDKYFQIGRIDFVDRDKDIDESVLDDMADLNTVLDFKSYDDLKAILFDGEADDEEEEDDEAFGEEAPVEKEEVAEEPKRKTASEKVVPKKEEVVEEPAAEDDGWGNEDDGTDW